MGTVVAPDTSLACVIGASAEETCVDDVFDSNCAMVEVAVSVDKCLLLSFVDRHRNFDFEVDALELTSSS